MVIETEVQIKKHILIKIIDDDVDGFLQDLEELFTAKHPEMNQEPHLSQAKSIFGTLHQMWLEVKQQL